MYLLLFFFFFGGGEGGGGVYCKGDGIYYSGAKYIFRHKCAYTLVTLASLWETLVSRTTDTPADSILGISHIAIYTGKVYLLSIYSVGKSGWLNGQGNNIKLEARWLTKNYKRGCQI